MAIPTLANIPKNQLDALPVVQGGGGSGSVAFIGGGLVRKWTAAQLGINGVSAGTDANGQVVVISSFLDVTGCRSFTAMFMRNSVAGVLAATPNWLLYYQQRIDATDVPLTSQGATFNTQACGMSLVNVTAVPFPAMQTAIEVQRMLRTWDVSEIVGFAGTGGSQGADVRLVVTFEVLPNVDNRFSMVMWGTS